jgi:hypothetical protein
MIVQYWIIISGIIFLIFRVWLVEFRLKAALAEENRYFSRIICYYLGVNMVCNLQLMSINIILVSSVASFTIITILTDLKLFFQIPIRYPGHSKNTYYFILIERITLHFPILIAGFAMIADGYLKYVNLSQGWFPLIMGSALFFTPFVLLDPRIRKRHVWPLGPIIFSFGVAQTIGMIITFVFFV